MKKVSFSRVILIAFLCAYMAVLPACNKDSNPSEPAGTPPQLPDVETMQLDQELLSFFKNESAQSSLDKTNQILPRQNWLTAVLVVSTFNVLVLGGLSLPVAATSAALSVQPSFESDAKWHWNYSHTYTVFGVQRTIDLELTGEVRPDKTVWEMYLTQESPRLDNFLWYQGEIAISGENGFWLFYNLNKPNERAEQVRIDWTFNSETDREIRFTDVNEGSETEGNMLTYDYLDPTVQVLFEKAANGDSTEITWNKDTGEGYIIDPNYNDGEKACWDDEQMNVDCTE